MLLTDGLTDLNTHNYPGMTLDKEHLNIKKNGMDMAHPSGSPILLFMLHDVVSSVGLTLHKVKHYGRYVSEGLNIHFVHEKIQSVRVC